MSLLEYDESRENAYLRPVNNIAEGKAVIGRALKNHEKKSDIKKYAVSRYPSYDFGEDIIIDSLLR